MNAEYVEEEHIGKTIIDEFFTKTRLNVRQSGHRLWINSKGSATTPRFDNADLHSTDQPDIATNDIPPPPGLEQPQLEQPERQIDNNVHPTP
eukprot:984923-Amphidinium_carterae.1